MNRLSRSVLALAACGLLLAACAGQGADSSPSPSADATRPVRSAPPLATVPPSDAPVIGEVPAEFLANVVADAAERAEVDAAAVEVVEAMAMTWNDGSLGCPEPGMFYTQALVDGYHVILAAGGEEFDYRLTANGGSFLCENGRPGG